MSLLGRLPRVCVCAEDAWRGRTLRVEVQRRGESGHGRRVELEERADAVELHRHAVVLVAVPARQLEPEPGLFLVFFYI